MRKKAAWAVGLGATGTRETAGATHLPGLSRGRLRSSGIITPEDLNLPRESPGRWVAPAVSRVPVAPRPTAHAAFLRMRVHGESFWPVVYEPFMSRDLNRHDLRAIV